MTPSRGERAGVEILIAKDSATRRDQLKRLLEGRGYSVTSAADGRAALEAARRRMPSLVITDIVMQELDGYGLCKALKSNQPLKHVPVILLTTLSDAGEVVHGLECGADDIIRKPYQDDQLLQRIDDLLMNLELRGSQKAQAGMEINLRGRGHRITVEPERILDLLISTYDQASALNRELKARESELAHSHQVLNGLFRIAEGLNHATSERDVTETALERALALPGIQAGWISLREGESGFRLAAARNLPPALEAPGAMDGECLCRRRLLSGELDSVANILECERLGRLKGDKEGLRYHAAVPLWIGDRTLGVFNLVGPQEGLFTEQELRVLYGIGNQVAVALERARLHEHLERLVEQRTAKLEAEIAERRRVEKEQARLTAILEATPDFVATGDLDGRVLYMNPAGLRMLGFEVGADVSALPVGSGHPAWALKLVTATGIPHAIEHGTWSGESAFLRPNGTEIPVSQVIIAHKGEAGSIDYLSTIARDISERKEQEAKVVRLNRVYAVLSGINTAIVRIRDRQELFDETCRIAVEQGGFRMAWIGMLDVNGLDVRPVAKAGIEEGYLDQIQLTAREDVADSCLLVAGALRGNAPIVCNDIAMDARMVRWREKALRRGYRSLVVFPLQVENRTIGLLLLYAPEKDFFVAEEMRLLSEVAGDISFAIEHIEKARQLDYLAYYDVLTGLPNRALFHDRANQLLRAAKRHDTGRKMALVMLDLERFRTVNDTFGRSIGDAVLKQVAGRLSAGRLGPDHLARIGADVFAAVLGDVEKEEEILHFLERRIIGALREPIMIDAQELRVSAKAGVAIFPSDGGDLETLLRNAEAALRKAKFSGDRYLFYTPEFNARAAEWLSLENKLRRAVEGGELELHYQPKIDLETGRICGLEALMRWKDAESGPVSPGKFIPVLEETGLILEAGRWALERAVRDSREWRAKGLAAPTISVNVSAIQLRQKDFVAMVEQAARDLAGATGVLEVEITESLIMQDVEANIEKLKAVRNMGITVAIDDFGTGYSSLGYIARLPVDTLKIDRAFIINLVRNPGDVSIVTTIISLAHSLKLRVVAEGVETQEQANLLRLFKCDEMQGYLFSPAVPAERIEIFLREAKSLPM
jgi:diguanylate cyclase (GGDEF)-like protein/PAS domain S-box-containing protein